MLGRLGWLVASCLVAAATFAPGAGAQRPPEQPPPGANVDCKPTREHPRPIVLVHGTFEGRSSSWSGLSPALKVQGYCVYALNYGDRGTDKIEDSAKELRSFVGKVRDDTRAKRVSIVGHSQGGLMARYYVRFLGGKSDVDDLVSLTASNHGTDQPLAPPVEELGNCPSCGQQSPYESRFTRRVNRNDSTPGKVSYTQITTVFDEVVIPYFSAFLAEGTKGNGQLTKKRNGPNTTNFCLQDEFPDNTVDHQRIQYDPEAFTVVFDALERRGPARPPKDPDSVCPSLASEGPSRAEARAGK